MNIIVITKSKIKDIPPLISVAHILTDLGHAVEVLTSEVNPQTAESFKQKNIKYTEYPFASATNPLHKAYEYRMFRKNVKQHLAKTSFDLLWIEGAHTIRSLGDFIKKYKYCLQISELHNEHPAQMKSISKVISTAKLVFMPEYNRTILYRIWFNLKHRPIVLPNKPYFYPKKEDIERIETKYTEMLSIFKSKKVILYQGQIAATRDLSNYIKAVKELGEDYCTVLLGNDHNMVKKYKEIDENLVHINFIPAPDYLLFTSMAHIGILTYNPSSLNNMYCAPNKIYEYSKYSLPMLGNDIPGLKYAIEPYNAGVIIDEESVESIKNGILEIDNNYKNYKLNSSRIFTEQDNKKIIQEALDSMI